MHSRRFRRMVKENQQVILVQRPGKNAVTTPDCFNTVPCEMPVLSDPDSVLIRTTMLSVDPALRCRLNEDTGVDYVKPYVINESMDGFGGVGVVEQVGDNVADKFNVGDVVTNAKLLWPWRTFFVGKADQFTKVQVPDGLDASVILSCLGLIGLTVLLGLQEKGHIDSSKRPTVVVSAAAGACGVLAGQVARLLGAGRVVGIAGSDEKCEFLTTRVGYDAAVNYKTQDVLPSLQSACPAGIDCYFDNVGGDVSEAVLQLMNTDSHVILCGQISQYNKDVPYPPPLSDQMADIIEKNNITRERYLVLNYEDKFGAALAQLYAWLATGSLKVHCTVANGIQQTGQAFCDMMNGKNIGKQIVVLR